MRLRKHRVRNSVNAALVTAIAAALPSVARAAYSAANTVTLTGAGEGFAQIGNLTGGVASFTGNSQATMWTGGNDGVINLNPAGASLSGLTAMTPTQQVGFAIFQTTPQAVLWNGSSNSATILHSALFDSSQALGLAGNQQVGQEITGGVEHAVLWFGDSANYVDLNPAGISASQANATNGSVQVGVGTNGAHSYALRWTGSAGNFTNLNPAGYSDSAALAISGSQIVGSATFNGSAHAGVWNGSTFTDLNPSGASTSAALGTNGSQQVGVATISGTQHAVIWNGGGFSYTDLSQFVSGSAYAQSVDAYGNVTGYVLPPLMMGQFPAFRPTVWFAGNVYRGGGSWNANAVWTSKVVPTSGDVLITPTTASALSLQYGAASAAFGNLYVDTPGSGSMEFVVSAGSLTTGTDLIGFVGKGIFTQNGGTHAATTALELGSKASGVGTYNLSGNASLTAGTETIANAGAGNFIQSGGSNSASSLSVGLSAGSFGNYALSGGSLTVTGTEAIGSQGAGSFTQTGGTHAASNLILATFAGSSGTVTISNGVFNVGGVSVGGTVLFAGGTGTLNVGGGTMTATGAFRIGNAGSSFNVSGGVLNAQAVSNDGTYLQTGGAATMGALSGTGSVTMGGGTGAALLTVSSFNQTAISIAPGGTIRVALAAAPNSNVATTLSITGGNLDLNNNTLVTTTPTSAIRQYLLNSYTGGTWSGTSGGITSSVVVADPAHKSIAYVTGANTNNATLNPALTNSANVLIRPSLIGDANLDGKVNGLDTRQIYTSGAFNDGHNNHDWAVGDMNYDGVVNGLDTRAIYTSGNFNNPAQSFTARLTSPAVDLTPSPTSIRYPWNQTPLLTYNSATGDVSFDRNGVAQVIVELVLHSDTGLFLPQNFIGGTGSTGDAHTLDVQSGTGFSSYDFGNILPKNLRAQNIVDLLTPYTLSGDPAGLGSSGYFIVGDKAEHFFSVVGPVPEPTCLPLAALTAAALLSRQRRGISNARVLV